jgi:hypothetical protein
MRKRALTPSIVPGTDDQSVYLVLDDLGRGGRVWSESTETTDLETIVADLLAGQYKNPVRVIGFNTAEGWSEDVSADLAQELRRRCDLQQRDIPSSFRISSSATRAATATSSCRFRSVWRELRRRPGAKAWLVPRRNLIDVAPLFAARADRQNVRIT